MFKLKSTIFVKASKTRIRIYPYGKGYTTVHIETQELEDIIVVAQKREILQLIWALFKAWVQGGKANSPD